MPEKNADPAIFLEELRKRITIPEGEYESFLELWEYKRFRKNEMIQQAGSVPRFSIFVLKGCLRQFLNTDAGDEKIVYFASERHFIGDLAALRNRTVSNFSFQAIEPCDLLTISADNWDLAFSRFPWWTNAHVMGYQRWTALIQQQMADAQTQTAEERYIRLLKEKPELFQRVPLHFIASYLGIGAETLSRIRKKIMNA